MAARASSRTRHRTMTRWLLLLPAVFAGPQAWAASDVSNNSNQSNVATATVAASVASSQASTIISSAATGGIAAGSGGFSVGGGGGFSPSGGGGGFSPSGGGGGFSPSGSGGSPSSGGGSGGFSPSGGGSGSSGTGGSGPSSGGDGGNKGKTSFNMRLSGASAGDGGAATGLWAQGLWANVNKAEASLQMRGNVYNVMGGIDHRFDNGVLVGLAVGYENVDMVTKFNSGTYRNQGVTVSPYAAVTLSPTWTVDAAICHTWLGYDTMRQSGAVNGTFGGERWMGSTNLTGAFAAGNWRFQPKTGLLYTRENQNAFVDSTGVSVASNSFDLGRLTAGSKVGYAFDGLLPYAKLMGEWDFVRPGAVMKSNGQWSHVDDGGGVAGLGVEVNRGGLTASLEVDNTSVFRRDLDVWATIARLRWEY